MLTLHENTFRAYCLSVALESKADIYAKQSQHFKAAQYYTAALRAYKLYRVFREKQNDSYLYRS